MRRSAYFVVAVALLALSPYSSAQSIQTISLPTNHMVYDPVSGMLFATVPSSAGSNGNSIATIDPSTASVVKTVFIGSEPDPIAVSGDGQYLYAGLDGADAVRRYTIATGTAGLQFTVGSDPFFGPYHAGQIAVLPGAPRSVAVTRNLSGVSPANYGVAIYDDGVQRPVVADPAGIELDSIAFSNSASTLYAQNNESSGSEFCSLAVDAAGVSLSSYVGALFLGADDIIRFDTASGNVYSTTGLFADPVGPSLLGAFTQAHAAYRYGGYPDGAIVGLAPDTANGRMFALIEDKENQVSSVTLAAFDDATLLPTGSLVIPKVLTPGSYESNASDLVLWGTDGLAFRTSNGQIILIDGRTFPGLASFKLRSDRVVAGATETGTVTLAAPAPPGGVTVSLNASNTSAVTTSASVTIPAGQISASISIATNRGVPSQEVAVGASYGAQSIAQTLSVLNSPTSPVYPANIRVLNLTTNDLVYDPLSRLLFASIPSSVVGIGNSITAINPAKGTVGASVFLGSEPGPLAISSDSEFIYAGLSGAAAIRRFIPSTLTADIQYSLGNDSFAGPKYPGPLVSLPAEPRSLAVSFQPGDSSSGGIAVYDDAVQRPATYVDYNGAGAIAPGASSERLYSFDGEFHRFDVTSDGVTLLDTTNGLILGSLEIKYAGGMVFASNGEVIDPENRILLGTFIGPSDTAAVLPDLTDGVVYFVEAGSGANLLIFDPNTFLEVAAYPLPGAMGYATSLTRWKANNLAFRTTAGQVFFVNATLPAVAFVKLVPSTVVGGASATGTVKLTNIAPLAGVVVTLTSSNPSVATVPSMLTIASGKNSASFQVATHSVTTTTMVTISATYSGTTRSAVLIVNP